MSVNNFYVKLFPLVDDIRRQYVAKGDDFGIFNEHAIIWGISELNLNLQYFICSLGGYFNGVISSCFMASKLRKIFPDMFFNIFHHAIDWYPPEIYCWLRKWTCFDISYPMKLLFLCTRLWKSIVLANFFWIIVFMVAGQLIVGKLWFVSMSL